MKWLIIPERRVKRCDEVAAFFSPAFQSSTRLA
jgi:hypothetical protein